MVRSLLALAVTLSGLVSPAAGQCGLEDDLMEVAIPNFEDMLGTSIAVSGDLAVAGAPQYGSYHWDSGFAQVYRFDGEDWALRQTLVPVGPFYEFGSAVTTDGTWIAVGSPFAFGSNPPTVHLYEYDGASWSSSQILSGINATSFGSTLALDGNWLAVGAPSFGQSSDISLYENVAGTWTLST